MGADPRYAASFQCSLVLHSRRSNDRFTPKFSEPRTGSSVPSADIATGHAQMTSFSVKRQFVRLLWKPDDRQEL